MILHDYRTVFIHINKTGGSSIEQVLIGKYKNIQGKHMRVTEIPLECRDYFIFSFVRNPWDKVVSQYEFRRQINDAHHFPEEMTFAEFVRNPVGRPLEPQLNWISIGGNIAVDFVGRYERLQEDFDKICSRMGFPQTKLPVINKTERKHYREYYDADTAVLVKKIYQKDIDCFGYKF